VYGEKVELEEAPGKEDPRICGICARRKVREGRRELARKMHSEGLSWSEIGRRWGVSRQAVHSLVREV